MTPPGSQRAAVHRFDAEINCRVSRTHVGPLTGRATPALSGSRPARHTACPSRRRAPEPHRTTGGSMKQLKLFTLLPAIALAACSNGTTGAVSFSLTSRPAAAPLASAAFSAAGLAPAVVASGDSTVIILGNDSVIVRSVELVLRQVELKRSDVSACDAIVGNGDCEEFETGATLVS